jgi:hypothetical protein
VRDLVASLGLDVELLTYRLCPLLPLLVLSRLGRFGAAPSGGARSDLHDDPDPRLSRALLGVLRAENAAIAAGARMPFGSSVLALARKR